MSNYANPDFIDELNTGGLDWTAGTWNVLAVTTSYTFDQADSVLSDIAGGVRIGEDAITGRTVTNGVMDGDDCLIPSAAALSLGGLWIYHDTGVEATSILALWIDTNADNTAIGGSTSADGIVVPWSPSGIYRMYAV